MKLKLNIQSIRIAEKILKKPFGSFDLADAEAMTALMYGMVYANNDETFTFETFKVMLKQDKTMKSISSAIHREFDFIKQFNEESDSTDDQLYISDLAGVMIMNGMDAHFVNYEMEIFEISDYLKAIDDKKKDQMESDRFWTYLSILPHINSKKLKKPSSLIMFPWEKEEKKKKLKEEIDEAVNIFKKFIKSKPI